MITIVLLACATLQPVPPGAEARRVEPLEAFEGVRRAYRDAPVAERVTLVFRADDSAVRRESIVVRVDPGDAEAGGTRPRGCRLDLGALRVWLGADRLVGMLADAGPNGRILVRELASPTLDAVEHVLPSMPVPQFGLAMTPMDTPLVDLTSHARGVSWRSARVHPGGRTELAGACTGGSVELVADGATGRLRRFRIELTRQRAVIEGEVVALEPGDPSEWRLSEGAGVRVDSLGALGGADGGQAGGGDAPVIGGAAAGMASAPLATVPDQWVEDESGRPVLLRSLIESTDPGRRTVVIALDEQGRLAGLDRAAVAGAVGAARGDGAGFGLVIVLPPADLGPAEARERTVWRLATSGAVVRLLPGQGAAGRATDGAAVVDGSGRVRWQWQAGVPATGAMLADALRAALAPEQPERSGEAR